MPLEANRKYLFRRLIIGDVFHNDLFASGVHDDLGKLSDYSQLNIFPYNLESLLNLMLILVTLFKVSLEVRYVSVNPCFCR